MTSVKPAYGYIRVSHPNQCAEGRDGLVRQQVAIDEYAGKSGFQIAGTYREEGIKGTTDFDDRPGLRKMLESLKSGEVRHVIIEKVDRLARDLVVQEDLIRRLQSYGVTIHSTMEPDLCTDEPTRVFIRQVLGAVAQLDRTLIFRRNKAARDRKRALNGRCEGRKPYGSRPGEMDIVARIRWLSASGSSQSAVAEILNCTDTKTRYGKPWTATQVQRILSRAQNVNPSKPIAEAT